VKTSPLYSLVWEYRERWRFDVPPGGPESVGFAYLEGTVEGRLSGRVRGTSKARGRADGRLLPDVQGVIVAQDGVEVIFDYQGYGCPYPRGDDPREDRTRVVVSARHWSAHPDWEFLNDSIAVGIGENRFADDGTRLLLLDVHEVVWEPLSQRPTARPRLTEPVTIEPSAFDLAGLAAARRGSGQTPAS
jgi:hypothetical protein